jgi:hypothetical protein
MCTEKDCSIFKGMLIACDACERMPRGVTQMQRLESETGPPAA